VSDSPPPVDGVLRYDYTQIPAGEWIRRQNEETIAQLRAQGLGWQWGPWETVPLTAGHGATRGVIAAGPLPAASTPVVSTRPTAVSVVTGIDPSEVANALYGKVIPLSALGLARIGTAGLIFGPYFSSGNASFGVSFGFPVNPTGTRRVYEVALDGKVAWELAAGSPAGELDPAGFLGNPFDCRFYSGTQTQGPDPLEAAMFGAEAIAYRPQMMLWFSNLPTVEFGGKLPFVSCKIGDVTDGAVPADGINLGRALELVAYSLWLEYDSSTFETEGVQDIVQAMILTEDQSFLNLLQVVSRIYRTLDILQTDKLRVNDRGATVTPDLALHRDHLVETGINYYRQEESTVARELELMTIDPDADYVFMPSKAARPLSPVPVTSSVAKETVSLPVAINATTRMSLVTYAKYQEDNARKRLTLQTMLFGYALEPGDLFRLVDIANGFDNSEVWKVTESSHGANYINEISAEAILKCAFDFDDSDPFFNDVILLLHADSSTPVKDHSGYNNGMDLHGAAYADASHVKYGAASFRFQSAGDLVTTDDNWAYWNFTPGPYTIELWVRFEAVGASPPQMLLCQNGGLIGFRFWHLYNAAGSGELVYNTSSDGISATGTTITSGAGLVNGVWYHLAVDKDSAGKVRIYVNGVMKAGNTPADSIASWGPGVPITVGGSGSSDFQNPFLGNIDDVRITARSRYGDLYGDASFAPPGSQFPDHI